MLKKILLGTVGASALVLAGMPSANAATVYTLNGDGGEGRFNASTDVLCAQAYASGSRGAVDRVIVKIAQPDGEGAVRTVVDITPGNGSSSCHQRDVQDGELYQMAVIVVFKNGARWTGVSETFVA